MEMEDTTAIVLRFGRLKYTGHFCRVSHGVETDFWSPSIYHTNISHTTLARVLSLHCLHHYHIRDQYLTSANHSALPLLRLATAMSATCYYFNGMPLPATDRQMRPCQNDPVKTICCSIGRDNGPRGNIAYGLTQDTCMDNGQYCHNSDFCLREKWY